MKNYEDIKNIAKKCLKCKNPLCVKACPISNPIPDILRAIENDNLDLAKTLLFKNSNASIACGYLCDHLRRCFGNCALSNKGEGVKFYEVEQFLAQDIINYKDKTLVTKEKVAIIGSGISGISSAIDLRCSGYDVTIFEKNPYLGGVLKSSLPTFRYDDKIVDTYAELLEKLDIKVCYNMEFGKNLLLEDLKEYRIIILSMGTSIVNSIMKPSKYVTSAISVLEQVKEKKLDITGLNCVVLGGGNIATDVARALKKNNNDVVIAYRRNLESSPASTDEINATLEEKIKWITCISPKDYEIIDDKVVITFNKTMLVEDQKSSRKQFKLLDECVSLKADLIVESVGTYADYSYLDKELNMDLYKYFKEKDYIIYKDQVIFATGDYLTGAATFVDAAASSKKTVERIKEAVWK